MAIEYKRGDLLGEEVEALVNTVNCVGVMGRGVALQFKKAFPDNYKAYAAACKRGDVQPGRMFVYETGQLTRPRLIINFPTKRHWRGPSRLTDIEAGLEDLVAVIKQRRVQSVAMPPLGSGLGGLDWSDVRARIEEAMGVLGSVRVVVYEPRVPSHAYAPTKSRKIPKMTPGRAALVGLMERYLHGLMDPFVSLLEVHKLMYFMQESGERLRLRYVAAPYGPYAENLRHVLRDIEGHLVSGYAEGGDTPEKPLALVPGAAADAAAFLGAHPKTRERFDRVADLVGGFETPFGLELLSTVHWVTTRDRVTTQEEVVARTYAWGDRKRRFSEQQIAVALDVLTSKGWVEPRAGVSSSSALNT
jgi:O-acetyl-ADP-ribose deacetylase (regulator of RNase III)